MYQIIKEANARIKISKKKKITSKLLIFYNPVMKFNRDINILLLNSINKNNMQIALPLAGTGVRGIRFLLELKKNKIKNISFNDNNKNFPKIIKTNLRLNKINKAIKIFNEDANLFLLKSSGFDYIDIDPFGSPNPFLDSAIKRLARGGILAVTATDTSALCGTYPNACKRKYWAIPLRNEIMHEFGLRILIRKIQLIGSQYDKALLPIFSYYKDHYMRLFLLCEKGKTKVTNILKQHSHFQNSGPIWLGKLWDTKLVNKMLKNAKIRDLIKFLAIIKDESKINTVGFYDTHKLSKKIIKKDILIKKIKKKGYKAADTHFKGEGIRSDIPKKELIKLV